MKNVNHVLLLMVSPFIIAACGGSSSTEGPQDEASANDVAVIIPITESSADNEINDILNDNIVTEYRKAEWLPGTTATSSKQFSKTVAAPSAAVVVSSKVESNGDNTTGWYVYDSSPTTATISSVADSDKGGNVIELSGSGMDNGYALGFKFGAAGSWNDTSNKTIKWSMKFSEDYMLYVRVSTTNGYRYLYYTANNTNHGISSYDAPHYIHNGLGVASKDGTWRTFSRNLSADLKRFEPLNEITAVDGFLVRGSGRIDDVEMLQTEATLVNETIYEDAEDGQSSRWSIYDNTPAGATIANVDDSDKSSKVIEVCGTGLENGFILGAWDSQNGWKNTTNKEISWDMKTDKDFVVYISVITTEGHRFITYSPLSHETFAANPTYGEGKVVNGDYTYIHLGLNPNTKGNTWQTVARNLEADLKKYEPNNSLVSVTSFLVRGCMRVDNVKMFDTNTDGDFDNSTN